MTVILILGSAPNVIAAQHWPSHWFNKIVTINNAWQVRHDWDDLIFAYDFSPDRRPKPSVGQNLIDETQFVSVQNRFGGFVYAGGTMAFTAAYWALGNYQPKVIAFMGCDMTYDQSKNTHFYGTGAADPLRDDVSLRDLRAKSARLQIIAAQQGCAVVNLSQEKSKLISPRASCEGLVDAKCLAYNMALANQALATEQKLGYYVPSGRYWLETDQFDISEIDALDALWREAAN